MKDETKLWITYARENLDSAIVLLRSKLFNPCLQNVQQCAEKALKALLIEFSIKFKKTHSISELKSILNQNQIDIELSDEECEFLDSIYLPSKYPIGSVLPEFEPDIDICNYGLKVSTHIFEIVCNKLKCKI
ncbi:HEPN domain-containing protein [candidate division KSB1 bacterium]|nr:HEPN domain-containing protein [candidate division KSB1 bacterium]